MCEEKNDGLSQHLDAIERLNDDVAASDAAVHEAIAAEIAKAKAKVARIRDLINAALSKEPAAKSCPAKELTLDEAIAHAEECADSTPCGKNHRQLADWLKELKMLRESTRTGHSAIDVMADLCGESPAKMAGDVIEHMLETSCYGNVEAMRDALVAIREAHEKKDTPHDVLVAHLIDDALSKPRRNCDVGTAADQAKRMDAYCASCGERIGSSWRCDNCPLCSIDRCDLVWAQMPYEAKEGDNK